MPYINYVNLAHECCDLILSSLAVYYSIRVLLQKQLLKKSVDVSPAITVYFGFVLYWSVTATCQYAYQIIFWRPENGDYNAYILYFSGVIPGVFLSTSSVAEIFLCVERCISLIYPVAYTKKYRVIYAIVMFFGLLGFMGFSGVDNYVKAFPASAVTSCQFISCFVGAVHKHIFFMKIGTNLISIVVAIILAILIKRVVINNKSATQMNKTVFILIISTTVIELIPFVSAQIYIMVS